MITRVRPGGFQRAIKLAAPVLTMVLLLAHPLPEQAQSVQMDQMADLDCLDLPYRRNQSRFARTITYVYCLAKIDG